MTTASRARRRPSLAPVRLLLALALTAITGQATVAGAAQPVATADFAAIDAYVEAARREMRVPGLALGIVRGDQIVHLRGFGQADPGGRPVTPQTPFLIASLAKSMTALAIMQLVEAGRVELDAPVQRYLPWFRLADPAASAQLTPRHLLNQTSGLPITADIAFADSGDLGDDVLERRVRALSTVALTHPVGATYQYSNANYVTLAVVIQAVTGQSYEDYVQQRLFGPLAMRQTFTSQAVAQQHGMSAGHRYWFGVPVAFDAPFNRGALGAGQVIASAEDMARYLLVHLNGGRAGEAVVLSPRGIAELHRPAAAVAGGGFYGMGWETGAIGDVPVVEHGGDLSNFHARMILVPSAGWGVVLLVNAEAYLGTLAGDRARTELAQGVVRLLLGQAPPPVTPGRGPLLVYGALLAILVVQAGGMLASAARLRRWREQPASRPRGRWRVAAAIGLPLAINLAWAGATLLASPVLLGFPLAFWLLALPDVSRLLIVSGAVALGWGIVRTALAVAVLRPAGARTGRSEPVHA